MALFDFLKKDDGNFFQWFEDAANNASTGRDRIAQPV